MAVDWTDLPEAEEARNTRSGAKQGRGRPYRFQESGPADILTSEF